VTFIQFKICCCVQNFIKIRWFFTEIWRYNDFQNGGRPPSWNYFTTIRDHPRSPCCWPQLHIKFHVNLIHRSEDVAIWIIRIFGLKCLFRPPKWGFWGLWTHKCNYSSSRPPKGTSLRKNTSVKLSRAAREMVKFDPPQNQNPVTGWFEIENIWLCPEVMPPNQIL